MSLTYYYYHKLYSSTIFNLLEKDDLESFINVIENYNFSKEQLLKLFNSSIFFGIRKCYKISDYLINIGLPINNLLWIANYNNNLKYVKLLIEKDATGLNKALNETISLPISIYLIEKGANNLNEALIYTIEKQSGMFDKIKLLINKGANNFNEALLCECNNGNPNFDIIKYLIECGADNLDQVIPPIRNNLSKLEEKQKKTYKFMKQISPRRQELIGDLKYILNYLERLRDIRQL